MNNFKQMVLNALKNNSNPIYANLVQMAENGDTKGLENFARNYCKEQGRDFDKEMSSFQKMFSKKKK